VRLFCGLLTVKSSTFLLGAIYHLTAAACQTKIFIFL
jgi:hypothetical protein